MSNFGYLGKKKQYLFEKAHFNDFTRDLSPKTQSKSRCCALVQTYKLLNYSAGSGKM